LSFFINKVDNFTGFHPVLFHVGMHVALANAGSSTTHRQVQENNMSGTDKQYHAGEKIHAAL